MNSINASPLMFGEDFDHFHCILRGNKRIVLVNTLKYRDVRKVRKQNFSFCYFIKNEISFFFKDCSTRKSTTTWSTC
jgi:hypothetical protein